MEDSSVPTGSLKRVRQKAELQEVQSPQRCQLLCDFRDSLENTDGFNGHCQNRPVMLVRDETAPAWERVIMIDWRTYEAVLVEPSDPGSTSELEKMIISGSLSIAVGARARLLLFLTSHQVADYNPDGDLLQLSQSTFGQAMRHALQKDTVEV